jgi:hypothetical protein
MSNHAIILCASLILWMECAAVGIKGLVAATEEKPASMILDLALSVFQGYLAASLWWLA